MSGCSGVHEILGEMCTSEVTLMVKCVLSDAGSSQWLKSGIGPESCRNSVFGSL